MTDKVNLAEKLALIETHFSVKAKGEFVWHSHPDTDDFFLVVMCC